MVPIPSAAHVLTSCGVRWEPVARGRAGAAADAGGYTAWQVMPLQHPDSVSSSRACAVVQGCLFGISGRLFQMRPRWGCQLVVIDGAVGWLLPSTVSMAAEFAGIQNDESFDPSVAVPALGLKAETFLMWSNLAFPVQFNYN